MVEDEVGLGVDVVRALVVAGTCISSDADSVSWKRQAKNSKICPWVKGSQELKAMLIKWWSNPQSDCSAIPVLV